MRRRSRESGKSRQKSKREGEGEREGEGVMRLQIKVCQRPSVNKRHPTDAGATQKNEYKKWKKKKPT